jgi:hypothetical protein
MILYCLKQLFNHVKLIFARCLLDHETDMRHIGGKIGVDPYSDFAVGIESNQIIGDRHIAEVVKDSLEANECLFDYVDGVFQGQMLQVAQPQWNPFDKNS